MKQTDKIIKAMLHGWKSTANLIKASGSLTPLARLAEWRNDNREYVSISLGRLDYPEIVYRINGKDYTEETRERKIRNQDGKAVTIKERRFVKVK